MTTPEPRLSPATTTGTAPAADDGRPTRGMTQARVESNYGAPVSKVAPVGEPPISRWEYQNMIVYFEYDRVLFTVLHKGQVIETKKGAFRSSDFTLITSQTSPDDKKNKKKGDDS